MSSLAEDLPKEIQRNRELLDMYKEIPMGFIGASLIDIDIKQAIKALADGDVIAMLQSYEKLKGNE